MNYEQKAAILSHATNEHGYSMPDDCEAYLVIVLSPDSYSGISDLSGSEVMCLKAIKSQLSTEDKVKGRKYLKHVAFNLSMMFVFRFLVLFLVRSKQVFRHIFRTAMICVADHRFAYQNVFVRYIGIFTRWKMICGEKGLENAQCHNDATKLSTRHALMMCRLLKGRLWQWIQA